MTPEFFALIGIGFFGQLVDGALGMHLTSSHEDAKVGYAAPLGLVGGFFDAIGGGGWGPMVTSTLLGSGQAPRKVIGSVNAAEFSSP